MAKEKKVKKGKLNTKAIKSANKDVQKTVTIELDGKEYEIKVDQVFKVSKMDDMVTELMTKFKNYKELPFKIQILFHNYLIIKHFTDVDLSDCKTIEDDIKVMDGLLDLGMFEKILPEFKEEELLKITDYMVTLRKKFSDLVNDEDAMKEVENIMKDISAIENKDDELVN